jgi:hypothetical protein
MLFKADGADYTMGGGHTVVYAQGYKDGVPVGGEAHHIVVEPTVDDPPVPTWTHTTTFTPTPTTTASTTPTPSPTITDSPEKPLVITDIKKPYGDVDETTQGENDEPFWNGTLMILNAEEKGLIKINKDDVLILLNDTTPMVPMKYYTVSSDNEDARITSPIPHYGKTGLFSPIFKFFDNSEKLMYDAIAHEKDGDSYIPHTVLKENTKFNESDQTVFFILENPVPVRISAGIVKMINVISNDDSFNSFTITDDGTHWISFCNLLGDKKIRSQINNFTGLKEGSILYYKNDRNSTMTTEYRLKNTSYFEEWEGLNWSHDTILETTNMYMIKNSSGLNIKNEGTQYINNTVSLNEGVNWVGFPFQKQISIENQVVQENTLIRYKNDINSTMNTEYRFSVPDYFEYWDGLKWSKKITLKPNNGIMIESPSDQIFLWEEPATGAASSGQATFEVKHKGEGKFEGTTTDATQFEIEINLETLNPMEFYAGSNLKYDEGGTSKYSVGGTDELASVDRVSDDVDGRLSSESNKTDGHRYRKIRSIEIHVNKHVYLDLSKGDTIMTKDKDSALADDVVGPPSAGDDDYRKMYTYCARGTDGVDKYTKIMIVNADVDIRTKLALEKYKLKLPENMYVATGDYDSMEIDYSKSYIGTTSVFSRRYDPGSYTHQKYSGDTHGRYDIHNWGFKLNDGVTEVEDGSKGSYLRYSIDDSLKIHKGGVFTTDDSSSRKIYEYIEEGNVEGNVDFFSLT